MSQIQRRAYPRVRVSIRARMRDGLRYCDICVLDISQRGFMATTATPPKRGEFVEIVLGTTWLVGQVRWASHHRFGIALQERIDVGAIATGNLSNFRAKLSERRAADTTPVAATALDTARRIRCINFCLALAAAVGAAIFLADSVSDELGVLAQASEAMASSRAGYRR